MSSSIIILDGGLGTLLCDTSSPEASTSPLWSSVDLLSRPERILDIHKQYVDVGADVILTATYQISHETLKRAGVVGQDDMAIICGKGMGLALDAAIPSKDVSVAVSLGCFGSCLQPSQEYSGVYPFPYTINSSIAIGSLRDWHMQRVREFSSQVEFHKIGILAFETVPWNRLDEIQAIRQVIDTKEYMKKKAWISMVFPESLPEETVATIVTQVYKDTPPESAPRGIGVNCTKLPIVKTIVRAYTKSIKALNLEKSKAFLVIYPDGGLTYDANSKTWSDEDGLSDVEKWSNEVMDIAKEAYEENCWGNIVVGGCCKTRPDHIRALKRLSEGIAT